MLLTQTPWWIDLTLANNIDDADKSTISWNNDDFDHEGEREQKANDNDNKAIISTPIKVASSTKAINNKDTNMKQQEGIKTTTTINKHLEEQQQQGHWNKNAKIKLSNFFDNTSNSPRGFDYVFDNDDEAQH